MLKFPSFIIFKSSGCSLLSSSIYVYLSIIFNGNISFVDVIYLITIL